MRAFLGDILAQRARGNPRSMVIAKEARDFLRHTALNPERIRVLLAKEENNKGGDNAAEDDSQKRVRQSDLMLQVEDLLRKHFPLFREMYKYYSTSLGEGGGSGITVESVMRIYQDCKLRSAKFPPHMVETIFRETLSAVENGKTEKTDKEKDKEKEKEKEKDETEKTEKDTEEEKEKEKDSEAQAPKKGKDKDKDEEKGEDSPTEESPDREANKGLPPEGFVEVLLHIAARRYADVGPLPEQLISLIQKNLKPYACRESENFFHKMAYDPEVRAVLRAQTEDLAVVFEVYSALDTGDEGAAHLHTMNMKEFHSMLGHCDMMDELFDEAVVNTIFENIQQEEDTGELEVAPDDDAEEGEMEADTDEPVSIGGDDEGGRLKFRFGHLATSVDEAQQGLEGVGDDNELAFSEFIDGLVAIVMYKDPNPFVPFHDRVGSFLESFFKALYKHWSGVDEEEQTYAVKSKLMPRLRDRCEPKEEKKEDPASPKSAKDGKTSEPASPKKDPNRPTIQREKKIEGNTVKADDN